METPPNAKIRPQRTPTPKMSERKKALFTSGRSSPINEENDNNQIEGIDILTPKKNSTTENRYKRMTRSSLKKFSEDLMTLLNSESFQNSLPTNDGPSSSRHNDTSPDSAISHTSSSYTIASHSDTSKTRSSKTSRSSSSSSAQIKHGTDELRDLFKQNLNLKNAKENESSDTNDNSLLTDVDTHDISLPESNDEGPSVANKRNNKHLQGSSPQPKQQKLDRNSNEKSEIVPNRTSTQISPNIHIPTKCFYSKQSSNKQKSPKIVRIYQNYTIKEPKKKQKPKKKLFNKGVVHKIKRLKHTEIPIEQVLESIKNAKLRSLPSKRLPPEKVEEVHRILRRTQNSIELARPLQIYNTDDNSDFLSSDEENTELMEVLPSRNPNADDEIVAPLQNRKFFKYRQNPNNNHFNIRGDLNVTVSKGKMQILPSKKKRRNNSNKFAMFEESFTAEQATINEIIEQLDDSQIGSPGKSIFPKEISTKSQEIENDEIVPPIEQYVEDDGEYTIFRNRIPYKTNDPELIERQHLLLDFLIQNNICTEENFTIFIADPDNHKKDAAAILDNFQIIVTNDDVGNINQDLDEVAAGESINSTGYYEQISNNSTENGQAFDLPASSLNSDVIVSVNRTDLLTSSCNTDAIVNDAVMETDQNGAEDNFKNIEKSIVNNNNEENLFPVFYRGKCQPIIQQSKRQFKKNGLRGMGSTQYQIDAGQKEFGAHQCSECGLVYTVHEPEEENLHKSYHNSLYLLKFQGWIDEDVIKPVYDWGIRGRIICVTNTSHVKHQQRILDILDIVDKEIGYNMISLPSQYNAYVAVGKNQILGICLIQPVENANRYIVLNGIECCTEETYDVKCGISRIWVSPFRRRSKVATRLIETVKTHWIPGSILTMNDIAFSPPTDEGIAFAQKMCNRKDFLIFQ